MGKHLNLPFGLSLTLNSSAVCALGKLSPPSVQCGAEGTGVRRSREDYLGEVDFGSSNQDGAGVSSGSNKINANGGVDTMDLDQVMGSAFATHDFGHGKPCGMPEKVDDALLYK